MFELQEKYRHNLDDPIIQALEEAGKKLLEYVEIVQDNTPLASADVPEADTRAWIEAIRAQFEWVCEVTKFNWGYVDDDEDDDGYEVEGLE